MSEFKVIAKTIKHKEFSINALFFIPKNEKPVKAIFTHGYTASKSSILTWGSRFAEAGIATALFDLPGHYLGSYNEVSNQDEFKKYAAQLFKVVDQELTLLSQVKESQTIIGGHSLGALLSLIAAQQNYINPNLIIAVGFGFSSSENDQEHAFNKDFYKKVFTFRQQLVSPSLRGDFILPWIKEQKESLSLTGQNILVLTGRDDLVVSLNGSENLADQLRARGNNVELVRPNKMSHHMPELAAPHMMAYLRQFFDELK